MKLVRTVWMAQLLAQLYLLHYKLATWAHYSSNKKIWHLWALWPVWPRFINTIVTYCISLSSYVTHFPQRNHIFFWFCQKIMCQLTCMWVWIIKKCLQIPSLSKIVGGGSQIYGLEDEAIPEHVGSGLDTLVDAHQTVKDWIVCGWGLDDSVGLLQASLGVNILEGWQITACDVLCWVHHLL